MVILEMIKTGIGREEREEGQSGDRRKEESRDERIRHATRKQKWEIEKEQEQRKK
jgi:hypothetical protein